MPLDTRDCQPRCQHTLTQPSSTPTIRPVYLRRRCGTRTALHRVSPHALDGASLGSFSAPPQHAHLSGLRPRSPELGPAKRRPQRQTQHTRAVTAGWMTERSRSPRSGPVWCVVGVHACSVAFGGFPRYPPPQIVGRFCMCALSDVRHASRRALGCPSRVLPCQSHARWKGGLCANRSACLLALVMIPRFYPTLSLSSLLVVERELHSSRARLRHERCTAHLNGK